MSLASGTRCGLRTSLNNLKPRPTSRPSFSSSTTRKSSQDPQAVADAFISKFAAGQTFVRKQLLDANQLRLWSLTLDRPQLWAGSPSESSLEDAEPVQGTPLPAGYHLAYFTPAQLPGILGRDGTDASFNPDSPFTRRMWAGGSVHWPGADPSQSSPQLLRVGDTATEVTKVLSCEPKTIKKTGESMLVVGVEKEFRNSKDELCVIDRRNWVFRKALDPDASTGSAPPPKPQELTSSELEKLAEGKLVRHYNRNEALLFRFSALTFNAHRIHYDAPWAQNVEGHRYVVVHGPMNLIAMLDFWRDEAGKSDRRSLSNGVIYPKQIEYRATSPVYAGEPYRILMDGEGPKSSNAELQAVSNDGTKCMKGTVTGY